MHTCPWHTLLWDVHWPPSHLDGNPSSSPICLSFWQPLSSPLTFPGFPVVLLHSLLACCACWGCSPPGNHLAYSLSFLRSSSEVPPGRAGTAHASGTPSSLLFIAFLELPWCLSAPQKHKLPRAGLLCIKGHCAHVHIGGAEYLSLEQEFNHNSNHMEPLPHIELNPILSCHLWSL